MPNDEKLDMFFHRFERLADLAYVVICFLGESFIPETPVPIFVQSQDYSKLKKAFNRALDTIKISSHNTYWFAKEKIKYVIVCELDEMCLHSLMERCSVNLKDSFFYSVTMASSEIIHNMQNLKSGIASALDYAEYARFLRKRLDINIIDLTIKKELQDNIFKQYPLFKIENYERPLLSAIFQGDFIRAKTITNYFLISHLMKDINIFKTLRPSIYSFLRFIVAMVFKDPHTVHTEDNYNEKIWVRILTSETLEDLQQAVSDFYDLIYKIAEPIRALDPANRKIQSIIDYIKENYSNPLICENQICEKFNVSVSYLSHIFKEHTGMSFSSYIQTLRIDKAKKLLITTDASMSAIAKKIGYSSSESMLKMFRRMEGLSPSEFKRNYHKNFFGESRAEA
jgi:YesN/AraC family two-component response regulator